MSNPTQNQSAERAVLGAILTSTEGYEAAVATGLHAGHFADRHNRLVFEVVTEPERDRPATKDEVIETLTARHLIDRVGGAAGIEQLVTQLPEDGSAREFAETVIACAKERETEGELSVTALFDRTLTRLGELRGLIDDKFREFNVAEMQDATVEVDRLVSRIRTTLRGCWTDEAQEPTRVRMNSLRLIGLIEAGRRRAMTAAIDRALPALADLKTELSDRPVLAALVDDLIGTLGDSLTTYEMRVQYTGPQPDEEEGPGDRGDFLRGVAEKLRRLNADEGVDLAIVLGELRKDRTWLMAIADELDNAPGVEG